jgi:hypothetical protein
LSSGDFCEHATRGGGEAVQPMVRAQGPGNQQRILVTIAWTSFPVSAALTLALLDWQGAGVA